MTGGSTSTLGPSTHHTASAACGSGTDTMTLGTGTHGHTLHGDTTAGMTRSI